jgi:hypothetical protein
MHQWYEIVWFERIAVWDQREGHYMSNQQFKKQVLNKQQMENQVAILQENPNVNAIRVAHWAEYKD